MPASAWRPMRDTDLPQVNAVAAAVHPDYPEDAAVFAERLRLYPQGCHVLADAAGTLEGYAISHPWSGDAPPALNTMLHALPAALTTFYIHDIALLPEARGHGAAAAIVEGLVAQARAAGFAQVALVAVNGTEAFWQRHGFSPAGGAALAAELASYGGGARFMTRPTAGA